MFDIPEDDMIILKGRVEKHIENVNRVLADPEIDSWAFQYWTKVKEALLMNCLLYTSPSPRDQRGSRMPSSA